MPDESGILTGEDRKKVAEWLAKYPPTVGADCPICGLPNWMLAERMVQPVTLGAKFGLQLGGLGYPQIMLISPCGYTRYLNAVIIGIVPSKKEESG